VLLDGLDEGLDNGGFGNLTDWGKSVGNWSGGSNGDGGLGIGKRSSCVGKRCSGEAKRGLGVAKRGSEGQNVCLGSNGQNGEKNEFVHDDCLEDCSVEL
jgi:hypothetical protein